MNLATGFVRPLRSFTLLLPPMLTRTLRHCLALSLLAGFSTAPVAARTSTWTDNQGASFKAEPTEIMGPFALFNTSLSSGRRTLLRGLAPEECQRFHRETATRPARAASWAAARGAVTGDVVGRLLRVQQGQLVPLDLTQLPEPEIVVLLFGSHNDGESWSMVHSFIPTYQRIQRVYPGRCDAVFFGVRHTSPQHRRIALESHMPWPVADPDAQREMVKLPRLAPAEGILMLAISRDGTPLLSSTARTTSEVKQFIDALNEFLRQTDPTLPATWRDRLHYLQAVRPVQFAAASAGPVLVGDPLRSDGLRQRGITSVQARLDVSAEGRVTGATVALTGGVSAALQAPLSEALRRATFAPAIDQGKPVASAFDYHHDATPPPAHATPSAAELAWLRGDGKVEVPLPSWLVLRPIPVPPRVFSTVDRVDADGTAVLTAVTVGQEKVDRASQMNAFNSDFFAQAADVRPAAGEAQTVDEQALVWQRVESVDGFVNLQGSVARDHCVGYAWTELETPQALTGWLGIGSDDGLKIWLNGELVHDRWVRRISRIDDDIVPLKLRAGKNQLLIKIQNATGDWSFISRLRVKAPDPKS